jgi:hypothetical protein
MKRKIANRLGIVGLILSPCMVCFLVVIVVLWWRTPNHAPEHEPETILLSEEDVPALWQQGNLTTYRAADLYYIYASDAAIQSFYYPHSNNAEQIARHGVASYVAYLFVKHEFDYRQELYFEDYRSVSEWEIPSVLENIELHADEHHIGCAITYNNSDGEHKRCIFIARYGQYFSEFWVLPEKTNLTDKEFLDLVVRIDEKFAEVEVSP